MEEIEKWRAGSRSDLTGDWRRGAAARSNESAERSALDSGRLLDAPRFGADQRLAVRLAAQLLCKGTALIRER